uniref:Exocyst complex component Sec8 n=1 Tax=Strongyloides venezuelensis TaxID=75913 RepID=A0A0K0F4Z6_STRVS
MVASTFGNLSSNVNSLSDTIMSRVLEVQRICANILSRHMKSNRLAILILDYALERIDLDMKANYKDLFYHSSQ